MEKQKSMVKEFVKTDTGKVILTLSVVALIWLIWYLVKKYKERFKPLPIAPEGANDASGSQEVVKAQAKALADKLYKDIKGINLSRDVTSWNEFINASDVFSTMVYNEFGKREFTTWYGGTEKLTLYQALKSEGQQWAGNTVRLALEKMERLKFQ